MIPGSLLSFRPPRRRHGAPAARAWITSRAFYTIGSGKWLRSMGSASKSAWRSARMRCLCSLSLASASHAWHFDPYPLCPQGKDFLLPGILTHLP